jgi:hypothetical protein
VYQSYLNKIKLHGLHEEEDEHGQGKWEGKHHHTSLGVIKNKAVESPSSSLQELKQWNPLLGGFHFQLFSCKKILLVK